MNHKRITEHWLFKLFLVLLYLYLFLLGIEMMGAAMKGFGKGFAEHLMSFTSNPFVGLFIGILTTSIIQSSSATTSMVVGLVASGTLSVPHAIPVIMGANIGTTITNTMVSMAHITQDAEFKLAFPAAIVHDMFNLLSVAIFLPLEIKFHIIQRISSFMVSIFSGKDAMYFKSPLKAIIKPVVHWLIALLHHMYVVVLILAIGLIIFALVKLVSVLRKLSASHVEVIIDKYLFANDAVSMFIGFLLTAIVQSSSITTSIMVPLVGSGIIRIEKAFVYTMGANVGTTLTAIIASLVTGQVVALQAAFAHFTFNILGILLWYPLKFVPIGMAKKLGGYIAKKKYLAFVYVAVVFFVLPGIMIFFTR